LDHSCCSRDVPNNGGSPEEVSSHLWG
jgi:hypothetical protein